jgi:hypothetical protein
MQLTDRHGQSLLLTLELEEQLGGGFADSHTLPGKSATALISAVFLNNCLPRKKKWAKLFE